MTDGAGITARAGVAAVDDVVNSPLKASIATAVGQAMVATIEQGCSAPLGSGSVFLAHQDLSVLESGRETKRLESGSSVVSVVFERNDRL